MVCLNYKSCHISKECCFFFSTVKPILENKKARILLIKAIYGHLKKRSCIFILFDLQNYRYDV